MVGIVHRLFTKFHRFNGGKMLRNYERTVTILNRYNGRKKLQKPTIVVGFNAVKRRSRSLSTLFNDIRKMCVSLTCAVCNTLKKFPFQLNSPQVLYDFPQTRYCL